MSNVRRFDFTRQRSLLRDHIDRSERSQRDIEHEQVVEHDFIKDVEFAMKHRGILNEWEQGFIVSLAGYEWISDRQEAKLAVIVRKIKFKTRFPGQRPR